MASLNSKIQTDSRDHLSPEERSRNMSNIAQKDTKPEVSLRQALHKEGFRFRKNVKNLPGSPDIVLPKFKTVIFVHGCFWHRHDCKKGESMPSSRREFWLNKFEQNKARDAANQEMLIASGWRLMVVWECELRKMERVIETIKRFLNNS